VSTLGIDHVNLRASAEMIERVRRFYVDIVGLREGPRPYFRSGSHGHWLYAGNVDVLHLSIRDGGGTVPRATGAFGHMAFAIDDLATAQARLDAAGIPYKTDIVDERHQVQLLFTDPAGVDVELTFTKPQ
jgi:catechol 2,3-dioxygenase-like lactoylglutathione lyase family enzyme